LSPALGDPVARIGMRDVENRENGGYTSLKVPTCKRKPTVRPVFGHVKLKTLAYRHDMVSQAVDYRRGPHDNLKIMILLHEIYVNQV
jgi:hypothetical protein